MTNSIIQKTNRNKLRLNPKSNCFLNWTMFGSSDEKAIVSAVDNATRKCAQLYLDEYLLEDLWIEFPAFNSSNDNSDGRGHKKPEDLWTVTLVINDENLEIARFSLEDEIFAIFDSHMYLEFDKKTKRLEKTGGSDAEGIEVMTAVCGALKSLTAKVEDFILDVKKKSKI